MAKEKSTKGQTTIYKTQIRKPNIGESKPKVLNKITKIYC
jgi:hypothetical protein